MGVCLLQVGPRQDTLRCVLLCTASAAATEASVTKHKVSILGPAFLSISMVYNTYATASELFVARPGLFGQVISVVSATRSHIPTLNRFNLKVLKLDSKSNTLHTQWTAMNLI